jgi:type I restriction enzyme R subunit
MTFHEANTVRDLIRDQLSKLGWDYVAASALPRAPHDAIVEAYLRQSLIRLNPEIAEQPDRADEVIYKLRAILLSVQSEGLVRANEAFSSWVRGEHSMPFGKNGEHVAIRLVEFEHPEKNQFVVTTEYEYAAAMTRRADIVLFVNGMPLVIGECKTPTRPAVSWVDGAADIHNDYEESVPALFVANLFSFATEGKTYRYGAVRAPLASWAPWREDEPRTSSSLTDMMVGVTQMFQPKTTLDLLRNFTVFATDRQKKKIKIICRHQQYYAANKIVERVVNQGPRKGLIWHFQGSGKSLLMVFAAQKLRMHPMLKSPTVLIVVDRIDLDTQITATFHATEIPNTIPAESREELQRLLAQDIRKIIITTIFKFGEAEGVLNTRDNIIVLVDEAHRTQEGDFGRKMREALPNAFLFGLTGTPINRRERNTFWAFGAETDENGYLSKYSIEESLKDEATLPIHFEPRLIKQHVDRQLIDEEFKNLTDQLDENEKRDFMKTTEKKTPALFMHGQERVEEIARNVVEHYCSNVEPNALKAMFVCCDRQACVQYKHALDRLLPENASEIVITVAKGDPLEWKRRWDRSKDEEEKLLDRFRNPRDPLGILIVTSKLLTGFDAPILQTMYLDKIMKDHTLVQAICRVNRPYDVKSHGLIVDYVGVFDNVGKALSFDEKGMLQVVRNIGELRERLPNAVNKCLSYFSNVDRTIRGYEGLIAAQECLPTNDKRDSFASDYSVLSQMWEALSPDHSLTKYEDDYVWITQVYQSIQPPSGNGKLLWHALGAKTIEIINEHIHVDTIRDDLETIVLNDKTVKEILTSSSPKKAKILEIKIRSRLQKHRDNPIFLKLGERLEQLRERYENGFINSLEFLKQLLNLAKDVVAAEKKIEPEEERKKAKAALTQLFEEAKSRNTPIIVERIVNDIDAVVKIVRFEGWQRTHVGEREVQRALRMTMKKYQLHKDQDLFDRAYAYIKQYY